MSSRKSSRVPRLQQIIEGKRGMMEKVKKSVYKRIDEERKLQIENPELKLKHPLLDPYTSHLRQTRVVKKYQKQLANVLLHVQCRNSKLSEFMKAVCTYMSRNSSRHTQSYRFSVKFMTNDYLFGPLVYLYSIYGDGFAYGYGINRTIYHDKSRLTQTIGLTDEDNDGESPLWLFNNAKKLDKLIPLNATIKLEEYVDGKWQQIQYS